jgi:NAD(P)-dependent dehydrogenase (short-subunit alcohol dehydrogenase family)
MLEGKVAIVTGASRGIGRAAASALARNGAAVLVHGTKAERLQQLAAEIEAVGGHAAWHAGDVTDAATAEAADALARERLGPVDVLVNNAGMNTRSPTLEMPIEDWQRVLDVNLTGTLHFCRAVLPGMIERQSGVIVNVSSTTGKTAHRNAAPAYGASKAGVDYLTRHLALEMAPHGIRVNAVCPGPIETDMSAQWSDEYRKRATQGVPLGRLGTAEEIAGVVLFLASGLSGFITGETINANGGTYMN